MQKNNSEIKRIKWIDCAKAVAIMAVVVDHCNILLYTNQFIAQASWFSVSLFILLSGISARLTSFAKKVTYVYQLKKVGVLFGEYALATFVLHVYLCKRFDLKTYISHLLNFSIQAPYYFLLFFFQLIIISPFLISWCEYCDKQKWKYIWHIATIIVLCYCSSLFIRFTYMLPVYGGGQYLFGGTYIILYYVGILFCNFDLFNMTVIKRGFILIISIAGWIFWWLMSCYGKLPFDKYLEPYWGTGFNPPSIQFMVFAVLTLFVLYAAFTLLEEAKLKICQRIVDGFSFLGRYTLYTFMYHLLVKDIIVTSFPFILNQKWILRICVFIPMIVLPAIVAWAVKKVRNRWLEICANN